MSVRRCVLSQPVEELRPIVLGVDGEPNSYIHFPQFCGADLRIYRQAKYPDLLKATKRDKVSVGEASLRTLRSHLKTRPGQTLGECRMD